MFLQRQLQPNLNQKNNNYNNRTAKQMHLKAGVRNLTFSGLYKFGESFRKSPRPVGLESKIEVVATGEPWWTQLKPRNKKK